MADDLLKPTIGQDSSTTGPTELISPSTVSTSATLTVTETSAPTRPQDGDLIESSAAVSSTANTESITTEWASTVTMIVPAGNSTSQNTQSTAARSGSAGSSSSATETSADGASSSNTSIQSSSNSGSGGLSTGAIAGIAVGAAAIVAILAGFFIWKFCVAKRRTRERNAAYGQAHVGTPGTSGPNSMEKGAPLVGAVAPVYRDSPTPESQTLLPQQADDATVQSRFSTLYDQIELHAENFYKDASPMIPPAIEGALSRYDTPLLGAPLAARLEESPRTTTILKHVLSYEITTTVVDPTSGDGRRSLLPTPLLALLQEVQSQQPSQQAGRRVPPLLQISGLQTSAYSRLKQLAASYRTSPQSMPTTTSSATREAASHFTQVFSLWADPQYDEARRTQHLTEVLDSAVKFSVWLLSQPETFELRWDGSASVSTPTNASTSSNNDKETSSAAGEHALATAPALVKVTSGSGGKRLSKHSEKVLCKLVRRPI